MEKNCRICAGSSGNVSSSGLAQTKPFPAPAFDGHKIVATTAHKDLRDVSPEEWQAMGELIGGLAHEIHKTKDVEKVYVLAIGDVDVGHFHVHLVPKMTNDPPLGPHILGPEGWISTI